MANTINVKDGTVVRIQEVRVGREGKPVEIVKNRLACANLLVSSPKMDFGDLIPTPAVDFYFEVQDGHHESLMLAATQTTQGELTLMVETPKRSDATKRYDLSVVTEKEVEEFHARGGKFSYQR